MAQEINLGGAIYISSKRAAEISGYAQDYIGQLARAGHIEARRISGLWYVLEDSLRKHKERADEFVPKPPENSSHPDLESSIAFDGKQFVSAARASEITTYSQDYVAQLARSGKISARQVGNRWYIDLEALVEHKSEKDALLAAVQSESVGLPPREPEGAPKIQDTGETAYTYITDQTELLPTLPDKPEIPREEELSDTTQSLEDEERQIPIRVIKRPELAEPEMHLEASVEGYTRSTAPKIAMIMVVFAAFIVVGIGGYFYIQSERAAVSGIVGSSVQSPVVASSGGIFSSSLGSLASLLFSKELFYQR